MKRKKVLKRPRTQLEILSETGSANARNAQVRGNASGCHLNDVNKKNRIKNRQEARDAERGCHDELHPLSFRLV
jgi:hypothetical protein